MFKFKSVILSSVASSFNQGSFKLTTILGILIQSEPNTLSCFKENESFYENLVVTASSLIYKVWNLTKLIAIISNKAKFWFHLTFRWQESRIMM